MSKRKLHHYLTRLRTVPVWLFLVLAVFFGVVAVLAMRANNQKMIELREAVFVADEQGGDIETALRDLREHVYSHMNTDLAAGDNAIRPPIQLKYHYERLVLAENAGLSANNETVYTDAQNHCEQAVPTGLLGRNRLNCIREYIDSRGVQTTEEVHIPDALYKFDFASPRWSPDLAGISLVAAALCLALSAALLASEYTLRQRLRKHHH